MPAPAGPFDAILIPGGGLRSAAAPPPWVRRRLDRAVELGRDELLICLSAGTTHRPPPQDAAGFPAVESVVSARYLIARGVDARRVLTETCSLDTIGNAYFTRVIHTDPRRLCRLLVITSDFHMPRTRAVFEWVFGLPGGAGPYELAFEAVPAEGIAPDALAERTARERAGLDNVRRLAGRLRTLPALHEWLFTEHAAYAPGRTPRRTTGKNLDTY